MYFANWPALHRRGALGAQVVPGEERAPRKYVEEINDNDQFFGKVRQQYEQGDSGGRDIHVVTDWMAARMNRLGYVQKFDKSTMPNANANLIDAAEVAAVRPEARVLDAVAVGHHGIIYRKDKVKREPKSVDDLFDPAYKGKVTMLTEMRDTVGLVVAWQGADPEKATLDEYMKAIDKSARSRRPSRSAASPATSTSRTSRRATRGDLRLVRRRRAAQGRQPEHRVRPAGERRHAVDGQHADPGRRRARRRPRSSSTTSTSPRSRPTIEAYINYICPVNGTKE